MRHFVGIFQDIQIKEPPSEVIAEKPAAKEASPVEMSPKLVQSTPATQAEPSEPVVEEIESVTPVEQTPVAKPVPEDAERSKDLSDDIDLDFEEISDGELEEEACLRYVQSQPSTKKIIPYRN